MGRHSVLKAICPLCGREIELGLDSERMASQAPIRRRMDVVCPHCGKQVVIDLRDAFIDVPALRKPDA